MSAPRFVSNMTEVELDLDQIMLDANNPRLLGIDNFSGMSEERLPEKTVQQRTLERLNSNRTFDQETLRASIEKSGLLLIDRIVVRPLPLKDAQQRDLYVVIEGNRRIAACKTLAEQQESGEKTLAPDILASIKEPKVLVIPEDDAAEGRLDQWVIQGIRHISGIKPWGAYQAARAIEAMFDRLGYAEKDVADALSISIQRVRRSRRVLAALRQMEESEDYGSFSGSETYAYFDEVLKRPAVRKWLGWSDDSMTFENVDSLNEFYAWITPDDELDGRRRIGPAEGVRKLDKIIDDDAALAALNAQGGTLDHALQIVAPQTGPDWIDPLKRALSALDVVPISDLENMSDEHKELIQKLVDTANKRLQQSTTLSA